MLKRLLLSLLIIIVTCCLPLAVFATETNPSQGQGTTEISDNVSPESPKKNNYTTYYFMGIILLVGCVYIVRQRKHSSELVLSLDSIEDNGDGSYIISFGYDNPDDTISFNEGDCGVRILKGKAIVLKKPENNDFMKGQHRNEIIAVINSDSEIECFAGNKKIYINGKDIEERGGKKRE